MNFCDRSGLNMKKTHNLTKMGVTKCFFGKLKPTYPLETKNKAFFLYFNDFLSFFYDFLRKCQQGYGKYTPKKSKLEDFCIKSNIEFKIWHILENVDKN